MIKASGAELRSGLSFIPAALRVRDAAIILGVVSLTLFLYRLGQPPQMMFDETHYVPAARALILGEAYMNVEHPPFGKWLIGLSMALFGDDPFGWRVLSALAGTVTVLALFAIAQSLFGDVRASFAAGLITILNQFVFIQARIAMLDVFMGAILLVGLWLLIDARRRAGGAVRWRLIAAGLAFGLAFACKWAVAPLLALAGLTFLFLKLRGRGWAGVSWIGGAALIAVPAALAYLASFTPAMLVDQGALAARDILTQQAVLYRLQTQPLTPHTYQSEWWQWPIIGRPIWYLYEQVEGVQRGVLLVGNPAIMWGGLIAVFACLVAGIHRRDPRLLTVAGLFLFSWLVWAAIPKKIGFYYYYYLPAVFLSLPLAAAFHLLCVRPRLRWLPPAFFVVATSLFVYFYPIIAAAPLASGDAFLDYTWFATWR